MVNITPVILINSFNVITPRSPVELLDGEVLFVEVWTNEICNLSIDVFSHSNNIINKTINQLPLGTSLIPIMDVDENTPSNGNLIGEIGCDENNQRQLDLEWHKVGNRIISDDFYAIIEYSQESTISFTPDYEGQNARIYNVEIQGAASRIADVKNVNSLTPGDDLLISINPDGLLVPGMIARGELVIVDDFGIELRIPIIFEAKSSLNSNTAFSWLSEPGNGLLMISIFLAISVFTGGKEKKRQIINPEYSDIPDF